MNSQTDSRQSKRELILYFFSEQLGRKFRTDDLHLRFGTSFRTRVSELNRNPDCLITIQNQTKGDASCYWAVLRTSAYSVTTPAASSLFGDLRLWHDPEEER
jgi:hypothetical protein